VITWRILSRKDGRGTEHRCHGNFVLGGNNMKNKKLILAIIAVVAVIAVAAGMFAIWYFNRPTPDPVGPVETTPEGETIYAKTITVEVVHGDGSSKTFTYHTNEGYLGAILAAEGLIQGNDGPYGLEVHTVDGEKADWSVNQSYWALYVGEDYATTGADSTPVNDGDHFKWVYTIG
jgi:fermentation-respiration switch protein FrsA (DUF1100 family)